MPLLMANGGHAFQKSDGVFDGKDTGAANDSAILTADQARGFFVTEAGEEVRPGWGVKIG
jgi:hypothetical protein